MNKACVMAESEEVRESTWDACEVKMDLLKRTDFFQPDITAVLHAVRTDIFIGVFYVCSVLLCIYSNTIYLFYLLYVR